MGCVLASFGERWGRSGLAVAGLAAALYVIPGCTAKPAGDLKSLAQGQMKSLVVDDAPSPAPTVPFTDAAGKSHTLAEFKGKAVIVNLWATWCAPCVQEMPTLAKLAQASVGQPAAVVPISLDSAEEVANAQAFIAKRPPLPFYSDVKYALPFGFKPSVATLPTTLLIDAAGNVRGRVAAGADWSGPDAKRVVEALEKAP
jgi:thiol-disulfide isomerase/thioredoxin